MFAVADLVDGPDDEGATSATLLGPFYMPDQPDITSGPGLIKDNPRERLVLREQVGGCTDTATIGDCYSVARNREIASKFN